MIDMTPDRLSRSEVTLLAGSAAALVLVLAGEARGLPLMAAAAAAGAALVGFAALLVGLERQ